jgi:hypothetical protein
MFNQDGAEVDVLSLLPVDDDEALSFDELFLDFGCVGNSVMTAPPPTS